MTQEFFKPGSSVAVATLDNPLAEEDDELVIAGYVVERDQIGILLDSGVEDLGQMFIPWSNIAHVVAVDLTAVEGTSELDDGMTL